MRRRLVWLPLLVVFAEIAMYLTFIARGIAAGVDASRRDLPIGVVLTLASILITSLGCFILSRRRNHPVGWIYALAPVGMWSVGIAHAYAYFASAGGGMGTGVALIGAWLGNWVFVVPVGCIGTFALLLFPDGHLPSPRWRPVAVLAIVAITGAAAMLAFTPGPLDEFPTVRNPLGAPAWMMPLMQVAAFAGALLPLCALVCVASLIFRARSGSVVLRKQVKWIAFVGAFFAVGIMIAFSREKFGVVEASAMFLPLAAFPVASAIAITRYRLFDIDRIVSRTVSYAVVVGLIAAVFVLVVVVPTALLGRDRAPQSLIIAATIAVVFVLRPAVRRVVAAVDRRFDRSRYDAAITIASFGSRLRDQIDIDTLHHELIGVVDRVMRPSSVSLWLPQGRAR